MCSIAGSMNRGVESLGQIIRETVTPPTRVPGGWAAIEVRLCVLVSGLIMAGCAVCNLQYRYHRSVDIDPVSCRIVCDVVPIALADRI